MADAAAAAAPKSWWSDMLGSLAQPLQFVWEQAPFATPLAVLLFLVAVRASGWHLKFWPGLGPVLESLTKWPDLAACMPGRGAQRRLQLLLADKPSSRAMQASEAALARWFGPAIWSPQALDKALEIGVVYPVALLALVWGVTGSGYLGTVQMLPVGVPWYLRWAGLLSVIVVTLSWWWMFRSAVLRLTGRRKALALLGLFVVVLSASLAGGISGVAAVVGTACFATVAAGTSVVVSTGRAGFVVLCAVGSGVPAAVAVAFESAGFAVGGGLAADMVLVAGAAAIATVGWFGLALIAERSRAWPVFGLLASLLWLLIFLTAGAWIPPIWPINTQSLGADRLVFVVLVFLGLLPLWNATLDVLSVGATRLFLRRYLATGRGWWWMTLLDVGLALLLTVLLFWGVLAGFGVLQHWGWGVDAQAMARRFRDDPTSPEVNWILWMAVTNLLPTLLHLGLTTAALVSGWLLRDEAFAISLRAQGQPAPGPGLLAASSAPLPASAAPAARLLLKAPLTSAQAHKLVNWVYCDFWLAAALPWCVALALWPLWQGLMHAVLQWLV